MTRPGFPERLFITGTDTEVGKTLVAAVLMTGLRGLYWKPIQSGLAPTTDTQWMKEKTGLDDTHFHPEAYVLHTPASPHYSAALDGVRIDLNAIQPPAIKTGEALIIEGAGGVMVPLNDTQLMIDLIQAIDAPAVVVAPSGLGMINHTLMTLDQLRKQQITIFGVVMNGEPHETNKKAIEHYGRVPVIAEIPPLNEITPAALANVFKRFDPERQI
ncbi:MAG: dethiobiotin synthase [Thermodesulfobacteriota bacterium]|nr:dethiobiotin synthase [Thermodesulfobacteriota bacterium]